jgi:hypothetical protein
VSNRILPLRRPDEKIADPNTLRLGIASFRLPYRRCAGLRRALPTPAGFGSAIA